MKTNLLSKVVLEKQISQKSKYLNKLNMPQLSLYHESLKTNRTESLNKNLKMYCACAFRQDWI